MWKRQLRIPLEQQHDADEFAVVAVHVQLSINVSFSAATGPAVDVSSRAVGEPQRSIRIRRSRNPRSVKESGADDAGDD